MIPELIVNQDNQQQFSNSIGRIFWEAWGERLILVFYCGSWHWIFDRSGKEMSGYVSEIMKLSKQLQSTEELSAMLESLNLRIEQERGK
jgi:hypothetical protein